MPPAILSAQASPLKVGATGTAPAVPAPVDTGVDNLLSLIQRELVTPLNRVAELAARIDSLRAAGYGAQTLAGERAFAELAEASRRGAETAARLVDLGDLLVAKPILADDYILVADSLRAAAAQVAEKAASRRVSLRLDDSHHDLAPVYGSAHWLTLALRRLLDLLLDAAPAGTHVLARLRQVGFHQLLTAGINHNQPAPATLDLLKGPRSTVKAAVAAAGRVEDLDLALASGVVELHGGTLRTDLTDAGGLNEFSMTLPTGEPHAMRHRPDCANCPSMHQAEQFARDIGELLNAMKTEQQQISDGSPK